MAGCISLGKQRSQGEGAGRGGQAAKGSWVDWYAQAAFPQGGGGEVCFICRYVFKGGSGVQDKLCFWDELLPLGT